MKIFCRISLRERLFVALSALVGMTGVAAHPVHAASTFISSEDACFDDGHSLAGAPLTARGTCLGVGAIAGAVADLGTDAIGAFASSRGRAPAEAEAVFFTNLTFSPNETVPITVTMELKGSVTGDPGSGPAMNSNLFEASVSINGLSYGVAAGDSRIGFQIITNAESGDPGFDMVSTTGSTERSHIDLTITYTEAVRTGNSPTIPIGGFVLARAVPAFNGAVTTVDFLDPASVTFSVPAGISYTSEGFLDANKTVPGAPELSTWVMVLAGFCGLGALGSHRARAGRTPASSFGR